MLELTEDDLLILFEFCHRICETKKVAISHPAEAVIIDKIAGQLERGLSTPFLADYTKVLGTARDKALLEYEQRMGDNHWIRSIALDQI